MPNSTRNPTSLEQAARTAVAASAALLVARLLHQREAYWAAITAVIILQSTLGATLAISVQRLIGTALGAAMGAVVAGHFHDGLIAFGVAVFVLGAICWILRLDRGAYRYAGVALAIVTLIPRDEYSWTIALHRFLEVSLGIIVGLALTAIWPEHIAVETPKPGNSPGKPA